MRVLFYPRTGGGQGSGHLKRCVRLALAHGPGAALLLDAGEAGAPQRPPQALAELSAGVPRVDASAAGAGWDLVVLDRRASTVDELERFLPQPVLGIDEGGPARAFVPFLIDCLPGVSGRRGRGAGAPNLRGLGLLDLPPRRVSPRFPFRRVLVSFGGEDPADLSGRLLDAVLRNGWFSADSIAVVEGPLFRRRTWPSGVEVLRAPENLRQILPQYDLVLTSWGLTTLEALASGAAVVNLNPSRYHRGLSRAAGVPEVGVGRPRVRKLRRLLADRSAFEGLQRRFPAERFQRGADEPEGGAAYFRELRPASASCCPVCGRRVNPAVARFPRRSYFRCRDCGVVYLLRFGGRQPHYGRHYFFEDYQKQYGRTYLEDFQNIKAMARLRLQRIGEVCGAAGPPGGRQPGSAAREGGSAAGQPGSAARLLDIGCALGPFLQAAVEAGYDAEGVELSEEAARYVREELGLKCTVQDFEAAGEEDLPSGAYDVVSLWYVVEHFRDPGRALRRVHRLLRPGGVLALATPSASGISARGSLVRFLERSPDDHVTVWPTGSVAGILGRLGFELKRLVVTGHHPERFPGVGPLAEGGAAARLITGFSRLAGLGDTFEAYALRREEGQ